MKNFAALLLSICFATSAYGQTGVRVYRYPAGVGSENTHSQMLMALGNLDKSEAFHKLHVYFVDGAAIRTSIYSEFVYGGNNQRYPWNPKGEIWIDNAISSAEYPYTLAHELYEDELMSSKGLTYALAHDSALMLEHRLRSFDSEYCAWHESGLPFVRPIDSDSTMELPLPDSIKLQHIYLSPLGEFEGSLVWIVDGPLIRRTIYPDFGFSGNDMVYYFIPKEEIWIDNSISCEETMFSVVAESTERKLMSEGKDYDSAYEAALARSAALRKKLGSEAAAMKKIPIPKVADRESVPASNESPIVVPF